MNTILNTAGDMNYTLFLLILKAAQLGVILAKGFLNINSNNEQEYSTSSQSNLLNASHNVIRIIELLQTLQWIEILISDEIIALNCT